MATPIQTVINLNGAWASGGVTGPFIAVTGNAISIDMSAYQRPFAAGSVLSGSSITMTFADDKTYAGTLAPGNAGSPDEIQWSNGTAWTRAIPQSPTSLVDLSGEWVSAGTTQPIINVSVSGRMIALQMPAGRKPARGYIVDFADIYVDFPDDAGLTARLEQPNSIRWSNNSVWQKVIVIPPSVRLVWEVGNGIKTLTVLGENFPSGFVTIKVAGNNAFTAFAEASGTFTASQTIDCTSGRDLAILIFEGSSTTPVITTGAICPMMPI